MANWVDASGTFASNKDSSTWILNVDTTALAQASGIKASIVLKRVKHRLIILAAPLFPQDSLWK